MEFCNFCNSLKLCWVAFHLVTFQLKIYTIEKNLSPPSCIFAMGYSKQSMKVQNCYLTHKPTQLKQLETFIKPINHDLCFYFLFCFEFVTTSFIKNFFIYFNIFAIVCPKKHLGLSRGLKIGNNVLVVIKLVTVGTVTYYI